MATSKHIYFYNEKSTVTSFLACEKSENEPSRLVETLEGLQDPMHTPESEFWDIRLVYTSAIPLSE